VIRPFWLFRWCPPWTVGRMMERVLRRVGEDPYAPVYYTSTEALDALNEGHRFFCLLTWCLETTGTLNLTAGTSFYHLLSSFSDLLAVVRVRVANTGARVAPGRIEDFDAFNSVWQTVPGDPTNYQALGLDLLAVTPRPAADGRSLEVTYVRTPTRFAGPSSTPEIPEEYHPSLVDYAVYRLRAKEGGQEFVKVIPLYVNFLKGARKFAGYVRNRMAAAGYDRLPPELKRDRGD